MYGFQEDFKMQVDLTKSAKNHEKAKSHFQSQTAPLQLLLICETKNWWRVKQTLKVDNDSLHNEKKQEPGNILLTCFLT